MSAALKIGRTSRKPVGIRALRNAAQALLNASHHEDWTEFDLKRREHYRRREGDRLDVQLTSCRRRIEAFNRGARPVPGSRPLGHAVSYVCSALQVSSELAAQVGEGYRAKWAAAKERRRAERRYHRLEERAELKHRMAVQEELIRGFRSNTDIRWHYESVLVALLDDDDADLDDEHPAFVFRLESRS